MRPTRPVVDRERVWALHDRKYSAHEIAKMMGCSPPTVYRILVRGDRRPLAAITVGARVKLEDIVRLHRAKLSTRGIAEELGCSRSYAHRMLRDAGFSAHYKGRPRLSEVAVTPRTHWAIRHLLDVAGPIQIDDVAERAGYDRNTVHRWVRGPTVPGFAALADLATALGCELVIRKKEG